MKTLLRGLSRSDDSQVDHVPAGARIIALDNGVENLPLSDDFFGQTVEIGIEAGGRSGVPIEHIYQAAHLKPLSPVHLRIEADEGQTRLSWVPRRGEGEEHIDENAVFRVNWLNEEVVVSGTSVALPFFIRAGIPVSVAEENSLTGRGPKAEILV